MIVRKKIKLLPLEQRKEFFLTEACCDALVQEVARELLQHVIQCRELITYSDLVSRLSVLNNPRNLDRPLGCLSEACIENGFPPISVMVVNKDTLTPGAGFFKYFYPHLKRDEWDAKFIELYNEVKNFEDWDVALEAFV